MQYASRTTRPNIAAGFTIVELLIVIVVIGILAAITIVSFNGVQSKAQASATQSALSQANKKLATYVVENLTYPADQTAFNTLIPNTGATTFQYSASTGPNYYCVTATTATTSYKADSTNTAPVSGACAGHGTGGVAPITNLITNPSFEAGTTGWTVSSNMTQSYMTSGGYSGAAYYRATRTALAAIGLYSPNAAINTTDIYTGTIYARALAGRQFSLRLRWYDSVGGVVNPDVIMSATATGNWQRLTLTTPSAAPAGAVTLGFHTLLTTTNATATDTLDIDAVMLTSGSGTHTYADPTTTASWVWSGTANASTSFGPDL